MVVSDRADRNRRPSPDGEIDVRLQQAQSEEDPPLAPTGSEGMNEDQAVVELTDDWYERMFEE